MTRNGQQRMVELVIARETLGARHQPEIELVFEGADIGDEFILKALGIVHQIARVDLEEASQQHAAGIRQMRPRAGFNLRKIALRDGFPELLLDQSRELKLRKFAVKS